MRLESQAAIGHFIRAIPPPVSVPPSQHELARWFEEEVQPHESSLRSYLVRSLPSVADAEDLMQDTYSRLFQAKEKGLVRSAKPLLFAIARNAVRDFIRRKAHVSLQPMDDGERQPVLEEALGVVEIVCQKQELGMLAEAIDSLPERCREVILLRKIKGMSQREIADRLGISENTVESLAVKGVQRIAAYLRDRNFDSLESL